MKLFIPDIKSKIKLLADWSFNLREEGRNDNFFEKLGVVKPGTGYYRSREIDPAKCEAAGLVKKQLPKQTGVEGSQGYYDYQNEQSTYVFTLAAGTILSIERVYIRSGIADFSSLTFKVESCPGNTKLEKGRFWAKLYDVNRIDCEIVEDAAKNPYMKKTASKGSIMNHQDLKSLLMKAKTTEKNVIFEFKNLDGTPVSESVNGITINYRYSRGSYHYGYGGVSFKNVTDKFLLDEVPIFIYNDEPKTKDAHGRLIHRASGKDECIILSLTDIKKKDVPKVLQDIPCTTTKGNKYLMTVWNMQIEEVDLSAEYVQLEECDVDDIEEVA